MILPGVWLYHFLLPSTLHFSSRRSPVVVNTCAQVHDRATINIRPTWLVWSELLASRLDEEQFQWLENKLNNTSKEKHICILSHIPIISFCPFFDGPNEEKGKPNGWLVPHEWMHIDARRIKNLFKRHDNIRACISGHIHLQDSVEYLGIKYFCNGALSGNWWNSKQPAYQEFEPAYAMLDFSSNGEVMRTMVPYNE